jgi:hypothetical protein
MKQKPTNPLKLSKVVPVAPAPHLAAPSFTKGCPPRLLTPTHPQRSMNHLRRLPNLNLFAIPGNSHFCVIPVLATLPYTGNENHEDRTEAPAARKVFSKRGNIDMSQSAANSCIRMRDNVEVSETFRGRRTQIRR